MQRPSRRAMLGALAASAAPAALAAPDDPIYAAIEKHRAAFKVFDLELRRHPWDADDYPAYAAMETALEELPRTRPRTLAGAVALLDYIQELEEGDYYHGAVADGDGWPIDFGSDLRESLREGLRSIAADVRA